jgi:acyl carrier protein
VSIEDMIKAHIEADLVAERRLDLQPDTSLAGVVDSSGMLELVMWLEGAFGVAVELDKITPEDFTSVRSVANWIRKNGGRPQS